MDRTLTNFIRALRNSDVRISTAETLYPGEIIASGTAPTGCGLELNRFLKPNDVVELDMLPFTLQTKPGAETQVHTLLAGCESAASARRRGESVESASDGRGGTTAE